MQNKVDLFQLSCWMCQRCFKLNFVGNMQIRVLIYGKEFFLSLSSIDNRRCISIPLESCVHLMVRLVHQCPIRGVAVIDADWYSFLYVVFSYFQLLLGD